MIRRLRSVLAIAFAAALGSCHQQQKAGHGEVSGQILPGSISDAMLPYDAVKSKAPLAPREAADQDANAGASNAADSADTAVSSLSATPDIVASPTTAASGASN